jgi:hypothetical protein
LEIREPLKKSKSLLFWFLKKFRIEEPLVLGFFTQKASKSWSFHEVTAEEMAVFWKVLRTVVKYQNWFSDF